MINKKIKVFFGGTFSGNSQTAYIGKITTNYLYKNKKKIFSLLNKRSNYFQNNLNAFIKKNKINAKVYRFHSLIRLVFTNQVVNNRLQRDFLETKNLNNIKKFRSFLLKKGIYYPSNGIIFFSSKTSNHDVKKILYYFKEGLIKNIN